MQRQILTSPSGNFCYQPRFDDLTRLAAATKAQVFYADAITNKLYGFYEECYSIIELDIPFKIDISIFFTSVVLGTKIREVINANKCFFTVPEYPCFAFPENRRGDFMNRNIQFDFDDYLFIDKMTGAVMEDCILIGLPEALFKYPRYLQFIQAMNMRSYQLGEPQVFEDAQDLDAIQSVINNKVSEGAKVLLVEGNKTYGMHVFKSLIGPITKVDKLVLTIRDDILEYNKFMVSFTVNKRKCKIEVPEIFNQSISITTHSFMLNIV